MVGRFVWVKDLLGSIPSSPIFLYKKGSVFTKIEETVCHYSTNSPASCRSIASKEQLRSYMLSDLIFNARSYSAVPYTVNYNHGVSMVPIF